MADATAKHLMKHSVPTVEAAAELLRRHGKEKGGNEITPEHMFEFIHEERFKVETSRHFVIGAMIELALKSTLEVAVMDWLVVHADSRTSFITTDDPIGFIVPAELRRSGEPVLGLCSQKITKVVPLSQHVALLIGHRGGGFGHVDFDREHVRDFNITVAVQSEGYVFGRDESLVRSVVRQSKVDTANPAARIKVEHIPHPTDPLKTYLVARKVLPDVPDKPFEIVFKDGKPVLP
jgi:hypothetical protein